MKKRFRGIGIWAGVAALLAMIPLASCRPAESTDIERVRAYHFKAYPHASIGEMIARVFPNAIWSERRGSQGEILVTAKGSVPAELQITLDSDASSITAIRLIVNEKQQSRLTIKQFFDMMYRLAYPQVQQVMGRWVNEEGFERMLYFRTDGTFHMHSWPWDTGGSYDIDGNGGRIVLRPDPPLDPAVPRLDLTYAVVDDNHIVFTDPDGDVFLVPNPLQFERQ